MSVVCFELINTQPVTFRVGDVQDELVPKPMPAYLQKGMIVTLVSGNWPLNEGDHGAGHNFVFQRADGTQCTMVLVGNTYECKLPLEKQHMLLARNPLIYVQEARVPQKEKGTYDWNAEPVIHYR